MTKEYQFGILNNLPFDVLVTIFSFLNQQDCLTCMAVNRTWYQHVPEYTKDIWKQVSFSKKDIHKSNHRREKCIAKHVMSVTFDMFNEENKLYIMMNKLLKWGCDKIESLEFNYCKTSHQDWFLDLLQQLAARNQRLTHLSMNRHGSNITLTRILATCPMLTHFTYTLTSVVKNFGGLSSIESSPSKTMDLSTATVNKNMIYLHVQDLMDTHNRLEAVLKNCPNLQYLIGIDTKKVFYIPSNNNNDTTLSSPPSDGIYLDELFSWCPKLIYFMDKGAYFITDGQDDPIQNPLIRCQQRTNSQNNNFYHLALCDNSDEIAPFVIRHKKTLESLILTGAYNDYYGGTDWASVFLRQLLSMDRLRTLACQYFEYSGDPSSLITLVNHCPVLDTLELSYSTFSFSTRPATFHYNLIESLITLPTLRRLNLHGYSFANNHAVIGLFKRLPALEELTIANGRLPLNSNPNIFPQLCPKLTKLDLMDITCNHAEGETILSPSMFLNTTTTITQQNNINNNNNICNIKHIRLCNVPPVTYELLTSIAHIPTLKTLEVTLAEMHCLYDDKGLITFFKTLQKTVIEKLTLRRFHYIQQLHYPAVIDALSSLPFLKELRFEATMMARPRIKSIEDVNKLCSILNVLYKSNSLDKVVFYGLSSWDNYPPNLVKEKLVYLNYSSPLANKKENALFVVTPIAKSIPLVGIDRWLTETVTITRLRYY
ncbi:hypothetical protein BDA99DRAFT_541624 [Phascolomyces articulosus]|uniref:F-box domain-containing protein n=1 Tax=Phascolomyces articulosus TaxID=60185 RepID=A0AAD5PBB3_9FUNG|nr:hypothetical protein BDA99DRAFT_541624 [Phascolomyces articulosus]